MSASGGYRLTPRVDEGETLAAYKLRVAEILAQGKGSEIYAALADEVERLIRVEMRRFLDPSTKPDLLERAHVRASAYEYLLQRWDGGVSALEVAEKQFQDAQDQAVARHRGLDRDDSGLVATRMRPQRVL